MTKLNFNVKNDFLVEKKMKNFSMYMYKDTTGYVGLINRYDKEGDLVETYFVAERKFFGKRTGGLGVHP